MIKNFLSTQLLLVVIINFSFGQNDWKQGYIITNQGDTIYGYIDNRDSRSNSKQCYFRKHDKEEAQVYTPQDISAYRFSDDKFFISKTLNGKESEKTVFLEFVLKGKVNLYHLKDENDSYFIEKDSLMYELKNTEKIQEINDKKYYVKKEEYKGVLSFLLNDANMQSDIQKSNYSSKSLLRISKQYHEKVCTNEECIIYEKTKTPINVRLGLYAGLSLNSFSYTGVYTDYSPGSLIGSRFEIENILQWAEKVSISLDFTLQRFTNYKLQSKIWRTGVKYNNVEYALTGIDNNSYIKSLDVNIKTLALKIPLTINYEFLKGKIRPYCGAGLTNMFILSQNNQLVFQGTYYELNKSIPIYHVGIIAKVGSKFMLHKEYAIHMEFNYEYTNSKENNLYLNFVNRLLSINIGFSF
jgi:hypothetical protein